MGMSLLARLRLLFISFAALMTVAVGFMYSELGRQRQDAVVINVAGRQRMLVQQMTWLAVEVSEFENAGASTALAEAGRLFEESLGVLKNGGAAPGMPPAEVDVPITRDPETRRQIEAVYRAWAAYGEARDQLLGLGPGGQGLDQSRLRLEAQAGLLVQECSTLVLLYQAESVARVTRLRLVQMGFFAGVLLLLAVGAWVADRSVLRPVRALREATQRIGNNDLDTPVQLTGPEEMEDLAAALNEMQRRLKSSRAQLMALTDTLEQRVAQRTRELEALNEVSREISSELGVQQVLNSVTEKACSLLEAEVASLCLLDGTGEWLSLRALAGPRAAVASETAPSKEHFAGSVLASREALSGGQCAGGCQMLRPAYRGSHLAAPLRVGQQVIGALCVGSSRPGRFVGNATGGILVKLADTASVALENARLYAQVERVAALEERNRIATEMHDGLAQTLSYLGLMTDQVIGSLAQDEKQAALDRLQQTRAAIEKAVSETRRAIDSLVNEPALSLDLRQRLETAVADCASEQHLPVAWEPAVEGPVPCASEVADQVLNITREAVRNAAHHARGSWIRVSLGEADGCHFVSVEDDGLGFDASLPSPAGHFGLQIMHARAAQIGGHIEIGSKPGRGTCVTLTWPKGEG